MTEVPGAGDSSAERVEWEQVERAARSIFNVWFGSPELRFAQVAWGVLDRQGLTTHADELERTVVLMRLVALGELYRDFCAVTWDERTETFFPDLAHIFEIEPFRLGQLVGTDFCPEEDWTTEELEREAIMMLAHDERTRVVRALENEFPDKNELFLMLILSSTHLSGQRWEDLDDEDRQEVLDEVSDDKLAGYGWITDGMPISR